MDRAFRTKIVSGSCKLLERNVLAMHYCDRMQLVFHAKVGRMFHFRMIQALQKRVADPQVDMFLEFRKAKKTRSSAEVGEEIEETIQELVQLAMQLAMQLAVQLAMQLALQLAAQNSAKYCKISCEFRENGAKDSDFRQLSAVSRNSGKIP